MEDKESITGLQKRINALQRENHFLRDVLNRHNIPFEDELDIFLNGNESTAFEEDQGARIIHPKHITRDMANRFYARFWGRTDVYAKRSVSKKTGKAGYYPQCDNFWTNVCPRKTGDKIKCSECKHKKYTELKIEAILSHLNGVKADGSDVIGVYPLMKNGTCRCLVFDFDNHDLGSEEIIIWRCLYGFDCGRNTRCLSGNKGI